MIYGLNAILYYLGYFIFIIKKIFNKKKETRVHSGNRGGGPPDYRNIGTRDTHEVS